MRLKLAAHVAQPWKVHALATDFSLDEVWKFPIEADEAKGETFRTFCDLEDQANREPLSGAAGWLFKLRFLLGKLGIDGEREYPIPGCTEHSVRERMRPEEQQSLPPGRLLGRFPFRRVYECERERLVEISNATVHALLHLGWVHQRGTLYSPVMAVYVKPRGLIGRLYMAAIFPFRILVVYPGLLRASKRRWERRLSGRETPASQPEEPQLY